MDVATMAKALCMNPGPKKSLTIIFFDLDLSLLSHASSDEPQLFVGEQLPVLNYEGSQPGFVMGSRRQQTPLCSFVKTWKWQ